MPFIFDIIFSLTHIVINLSFLKKFFDSFVIIFFKFSKLLLTEDLVILDVNGLEKL